MSSWNPEIYGELIVDNSTDVARVDNQLYLFNFCNQLRNSDMVPDSGEVSCWIEDFQTYLHERRVQFPVRLKRDFYQHLHAWSFTSEGRRHKEANSFFFDRNEIGFTNIKVRGQIKHDDSHLIKFPEHDRWETWIK